MCTPPGRWHRRPLRCVECSPTQRGWPQAAPTRMHRGRGARRAPADSLNAHDPSDFQANTIAAAWPTVECWIQPRSSGSMSCARRSYAATFTLPHLCHRPHDATVMALHLCNRSHAAVLVQPLSRRSIYNTAFTQPHSRLRSQTVALSAVAAADAWPVSSPSSM